MSDIPKEISIEETETETQTKREEDTGKKTETETKTETKTKIEEETGKKTETETVNPTDDNMQIKTVSFPWFVNSKLPLTVVTSFLFYHCYHL